MDTCGKILILGNGEIEEVFTRLHSFYGQGYMNSTEISRILTDVYDIK